MTSHKDTEHLLFLYDGLQPGGCLQHLAKGFAVDQVETVPIFSLFILGNIPFAMSSGSTRIHGTLMSCSTQDVWDMDSVMVSDFYVRQKADLLGTKKSILYYAPTKRISRIVDRLAHSQFCKLERSGRYDISKNYDLDLRSLGATRGVQGY